MHAFPCVSSHVPSFSWRSEEIEKSDGWDEETGVGNLEKENSSRARPESQVSAFGVRAPWSTGRPIRIDRCLAQSGTGLVLVGCFTLIYPSLCLPV